MTVGRPHPFPPIVFTLKLPVFLWCKQFPAVTPAGATQELPSELLYNPEPPFEDSNSELHYSGI